MRFSELDDKMLVKRRGSEETRKQTKKEMAGREPDETRGNVHIGVGLTGLDRRIHLWPDEAGGDHLWFKHARRVMLANLSPCRFQRNM